MKVFFLKSHPSYFHCPSAFSIPSLSDLLILVPLFILPPLHSFLQSIHRPSAVAEDIYLGGVMRCVV